MTDVVKCVRCQHTFFLGLRRQRQSPMRRPAPVRLRRGGHAVPDVQSIGSRSSNPDSSRASRAMTKARTNDGQPRHREKAKDGGSAQI